MKPGASAGEQTDGESRAFMGAGASEKRAIHARLLLFCADRPGITGRLSRATGGKLETTQIYSMRNSGKFSMTQWRTINAAMDKIEAEEQITAPPRP